MEDHQFYGNMAILAALRSEDPHCKVGCIIVDKSSNIIGKGFNRFPRGIDLPYIKSPEKSEDDKRHFIIHAEQDAILHHTSKVKNSTLYTTRYPCNECAKIIIEMQIKKVYYITEKQNEAYHLAKKLFEKSKVEIEQLELDISISHDKIDKVVAYHK